MNKIVEKECRNVKVVVRDNTFADDIHLHHYDVRFIGVPFQIDVEPRYPSGLIEINMQISSEIFEEMIKEMHKHFDSLG